MISELLLLSGSDVPFPEARISIHPPTIKEIGYIGEEAFFAGTELLNFSKDVLSTEDKTRLEDKSNFEIFMSIMNDKKIATLQQSRINAMLVMTLIFPIYQIKVLPQGIILIPIEKATEESEFYTIDATNFESFKEILKEMFCLSKRNKDAPDYNPLGQRAKELAEKLKRGREKAAAAKGGQQKVAVFSRYVSILSVGERKNMNDLLQLTVYQLFDEFERFELKEANDMYIKGKLAGAKDMKEVESWMKDIHSLV